MYLTLGLRQNKDKILIMLKNLFPKLKYKVVQI